MPAFGPASISAMFPEMHEIASQLALKWARHGSDTPIMVTDDFTRLTLDTIALCSMNYRFNSYYRDDLHPFVSAMSDFLLESGMRLLRPKFMNIFFRSATKKYFADIALMRKTAQDVIDARKQNPSDRNDLMSAMLNGVDPKTGQKLSDDAIIDNLITFLVAGHETTSGMLSFAFYELIKQPETLKKAQKEVDCVVGRGPVLLEHMSKVSVYPPPPSLSCTHVSLTVNAASIPFLGPQRNIASPCHNHYNRIDPNRGPGHRGRKILSPKGS